MKMNIITVTKKVNKIFQIDFSNSPARSTHYYSHTKEPERAQYSLDLVTSSGQGSLT